MAAPGRRESAVFSLPSPFAARVVAQGRSEQHNRTTPIKRRTACAILVLAVSDLVDPGVGSETPRISRGFAAARRVRSAVAQQLLWTTFRCQLSRLDRARRRLRGGIVLVA